MKRTMRGTVAFSAVETGSYVFSETSTKKMFRLETNDEAQRVLTRASLNETFEVEGEVEESMGFFMDGNPTIKVANLSVV